MFLLLCSTIVFGRTSSYVHAFSTNTFLDKYNRSQHQRPGQTTALNSGPLGRQAQTPGRSIVDFQIPSDNYQYDVRRIKRGQQFFQENTNGITLGWVIALISGFSVPEIRDLLLATEMSDTKEKSKQRYLRTMRDIFSWHTEDLFDKKSRGFQSLHRVNKMHNAAARKVAKKDSGCPFSKIERGIASCYHRERNKRTKLPSLTPTQKISKKRSSLLNGFSSHHMKMTQSSFVAGAVTAPELLGISQNDKKGLEDYVYLWWVIGRMLGIQDKDNVCTSVEHVRHFILSEAEPIVAPFLEDAVRSNDKRFNTLASSLREGLKLPVSTNHLLHLATETCKLTQGKVKVTLSFKEKLVWHGLQQITIAENLTPLFIRRSLLVTAVRTDLFDKLRQLA